MHCTIQLTGRRTSSQQQQFQAREGCLSTCGLGGLGGLGITSPAEHVAKALSCKQASPKLKVCRHESRVGSRVDIKLAAVRFQTEFGVTKSPNGLRQKLTVKEVGLLQNFCSSSPWSFWHHCASPTQERWILLEFVLFRKALPLPGKAGGLAAELAVGILELKDALSLLRAGPGGYDFGCDRI